MKVSVIILAFNEEKFLSQSIAAVRRNDFDQDDYEIIVVNNGSTDRTADVARDAGAVLVECDRRFPGAARNLGARKAQGTILAFLDADCIPANDWLREGVRSAELEPCVTGARCGIPDNAGWIERVWFAQQRATRQEVQYINSGNLLVPRALFHEVRGFDERLVTGEDYEFCCRAKRKARIIADGRISVAHLGNPKTLRDFILREVWHGVGALGSVRHKWFDKPFLGTVAYSALLLLQLYGLFAFLSSRAGGVEFFAVGAIGTLLLLSITVLHRLINGASPRYFLALFALYYFYYLGRMVALGLLLLGRGDFQRTRRS